MRNSRHSASAGHALVVGHRTGAVGAGQGQQALARKGMIAKELKALWPRRKLLPLWHALEALPFQDNPNG